MIEANRLTTARVSANASEFREAFLGRVHEVLEGGYRRLNHKDHANQEEPAITGELRKAMNAYLRDISAPDWADFFSVHDDPPIDDGVHKGKCRNRIDIRVDSSIPRPGSSFSFEAKRLARGFTAAKYVGPDGLGSFLSGEYARDDDSAGMIGYVQNDNANYWWDQIVSVVENDRVTHGVPDNAWWGRESFPGGPEFIFASTHSRAAVGRSITLYHTLFDLCLKGDKDN